MRRGGFLARLVALPAAVMAGPAIQRLIPIASPAAPATRFLHVIGARAAILASIPLPSNESEDVTPQFQRALDIASQLKANVLVPEGSSFVVSGLHSFGTAIVAGGSAQP